MKHTPGPWVVYDDGPDGSDIVRARVGDENYDIVYLSNDSSECRPPKERKANARLVSASPALLQALMYIEGRLPSHDTRAIKTVRLAIEQATGLKFKP